MSMLSAYWRQVKDFYITLWSLTFKSQRELDDVLPKYVMRPGVFHNFFVLLKNSFFLYIQSLGFLFAALANLTILFGMVGIAIFGPIIITVAFPVFYYRRKRMLSEMAGKI